MANVTSPITTNALVDYWLNEAYEYVKPAAIRTFAPISCATSVLSCLLHYSPALVYDDEGEENPDSLLVKTPNDLEEAQKKYLERGFQFLEPLEGREEFLESVSEIVQKSMLFSFKAVEVLNHAFQAEAFLCYSFDEQPAPFLAVGGNRSFSEPLVVVAPPRFHISTQEEMAAIQNAFLLAMENFNPEEKKFVLAHEFVHIKHSDALVLSTARLAVSLLNVAAWATTTSSDWISYLAYGALKGFGIELLAEIGISYLSRQFEIRADTEAIDYMGTNKGALAFFNKISAFPSQGHSHPHTKTRIENAKKWNSQDDAA